MARTLSFTNLTLGNLSSILTGDGLVYTPLGLNVTSRKYDADGNATGTQADTGALLVGYNTSTVPPLDPLGLLNGVNLLDILFKDGNSTNDSLRATSGNDIVYWDYATLFSLSTLSVPVDVSVLTRYNLPSADQNAAIEVFDLGDGNDILNLTYNNGTFLLTGPEAYGYAATAFGGAGSDVLWSGNLNDSLYGGTGDDRVDGGGGSDTIYGGSGLDVLEGGAGNDVIVDTADGAQVRGGGGDDTVVLQLNNSSLALAPSSTDNGDATDGNDRVFVSGDYASSSFDLGGGNDSFIAFDSSAPAVNSVAGGAGNDAISTWSGNDWISGGDGSDVLWGGGGTDTLYGGTGIDLLYGGSGDADQLYGGADIDYYYWARYDGQGDQIYDEYRGTGTNAQAVNALVVFPGYDVNGALPPGDGVVETDRIITDNAGGDDMVQAYDVDGAGPGTLWRLQVLQGTGAGNYVEFDQRDVSVIMLWNSDAPPGTPGVVQYVWDGSTYTVAT